MLKPTVVHINAARGAGRVFKTGNQPCLMYLIYSTRVRETLVCGIIFLCCCKKKSRSWQGSGIQPLLVFSASLFVPTNSTRRSHASFAHGLHCNVPYSAAVTGCDYAKHRPRKSEQNDSHIHSYPCFDEVRSVSLRSAVLLYCCTIYIIRYMYKYLLLG